MNKSLSIHDIKPTLEQLGDIKLNLLSTLSSNNKNEENLHFSKNLLEIVNKGLTASSDLSHLPKDFWLNNQNIYQLIESCICDFYAEKYYYIKFFSTIICLIVFKNDKDFSTNFSIKYYQLKI